MKIAIISGKHPAAPTENLVRLFAGGKNGRIRTLDEANAELKKKREAKEPKPT